MNYGLVNRLIDEATERMTDIEQGKYNIPNFNRHNYTRLVIKECCRFLEDTLDDHFAAEQLKEHFGL